MDLSALHGQQPPLFICERNLPGQVVQAKADGLRLQQRKTSPVAMIFTRAGGAGQS